MAKICTIKKIIIENKFEVLATFEDNQTQDNYEINIAPIINKKKLDLPVNLFEFPLIYNDEQFEIEKNHKKNEYYLTKVSEKEFINCLLYFIEDIQ